MAAPSGKRAVAGALDTAPVGVAVFDRELRYLYINEMLARANGHPADEHLGRTLADMVPRTAALVEHTFRQVLRGGRPAEREFALPAGAGDGELRNWLAKIYPIESDGEIERVGVIVQDVTGQRTAEAALRESEERFRQLIEGIRAIVWEADPDTLRFTYVSPQAEQILGFPLERWKELGFWQERLHPDDRDEMVRLCVSAIERGEDHQLEYRLVAADGRALWFCDVVRVDIDADGRPTAVRGVMVDITAQKRAEQDRAAMEAQLRHAQKMEAVGRLAGGLAHDFNNLLTAVLAHAEHAADQAVSPTVQEEIAGIRNAAERGAALTAQLLAFGRPERPALEHVDVNGVLAELASMLGRLIGEDIELVLDLAPGLGAVRADAGQLEQVVVNLAVNARDAMPRGGILRIQTASLPPLGAGPAGLAGEPSVMLAVSDTGMGMDAPTIERIFDPYFTTKEHGKGSGLGLATVYAIVTEAGGKIDVSSRPGEGSRFAVYLPLTPAGRPSDRRRRAELRPGANGGESVLLVEDEPAVRAVTERLLRRNGYRVAAAAGWREAEHIWRSLEGSVDLLLTDVTMPELSGPELASRLRERKPALPVVFVYGHPPESGDELKRDPRIRFVAKPFTSATLLGALRDLLDPSVVR
jgi:two-component system, cell cycle sensor histidine kinase and response regulator CckA